MIETQVSKGIISTYFDKLQRNLNLDVAIVGGGPSTASSLPVEACGVVP